MILLVEDDRDIRDTVREELELHGYPVLTANDGREALAQLREIVAPALIILDLMMPVMGGEEFLHELRSADALAVIPVVVFSAWTAAETEVGGRVQGFLSKPVTVTSLLTTVARFC